MTSAMRPSRLWVWMGATAVALAAFAACFGPQTSSDYYDRGFARFKDDKYKGSVADFSKAISIRPKYTAAYIGRDDAKIGPGQYEEAIADWQTSLELANETYDSDLITSIERRIQEFKRK